jgi:hypothetical protein
VKPAGSGFVGVGFESLARCRPISIIDFAIVTLSCEPPSWPPLVRNQFPLRAPAASGSVPVDSVKSPNGVANVCVAAVGVGRLGNRSPTATLRSDDTDPSLLVKTWSKTPP